METYHYNGKIMGGRSDSVDSDRHVVTLDITVECGEGSTESHSIKYRFFSDNRDSKAFLDSINERLQLETSGIAAEISLIEPIKKSKRTYHGFEEIKLLNLT